MFAASSPSTEWLGVLRIALMMKAKAEQNVPQRIGAYFDTLVSQVRCLAGEQCILSKETLPEAIRLAIIVKEQAPLRTSFNGVQNYESITPGVAWELLTAIDKYAS